MVLEWSNGHKRYPPEVKHPLRITSCTSSRGQPSLSVYSLRKQGYVVVFVVDSHIRRIVLANEETTVTPHRPIKCQSRLWSRRGTKVNGSHHGYNPLLRPTGIQIATKSYSNRQAMAPTNVKTIHHTSLFHIESNLDLLGLLCGFGDANFFRISLNLFSSNIHVQNSCT